MPDLTRRLGSSWLGRYGVALGVGLVAVLGRTALEPVLAAPSGFVVAYPAIMVSAWFGGTGPGILTTLLCGLAGLWPWTPYESGPAAAELGGLLAFLLGGVLRSGLTGELFRAKSAAVSSMVRLRREILERREAATRADQLNTDLQRRIGEQLERLATGQAAGVEAQRQQREAELLATVAGTLGERLELDALLAPIAAAARSACASDMARIALREPGSEPWSFGTGWARSTSGTVTCGSNRGRESRGGSGRPGAPSASTTWPAIRPSAPT